MSRRGLARLNAKRDAVEPLIVAALEARGYVVKRLSGKGCPDLLVAKQGAMWLVECKTGKGGFTVDQVRWLRDWPGPPPFVLRTVDEAMAFPNAGTVSTW